MNDNKMIIRKLEDNDKLQLESLIMEVENSLQEETFWLPITSKSREHFWDDEWTIFLGAFENEKLIGAVGLFLNENEYGESKNLLELEKGKIAELGRAMVAQAYRNNGIMSQLASALKNYASSIGVRYMVATVHPHNIPSQSFLKKIGFEKKAFVTKLEKYDRDILLMEV